VNAAKAERHEDALQQYAKLFQQLQGMRWFELLVNAESS
jgi:hypothetical protein